MTARAKPAANRDQVGYVLLVVGGIGSVVLGVGLVYPPLALVLGGTAATALGLLGLRVTR